MDRVTVERSTILRGLVGSTVHGLNVNDGIEERDESWYALGEGVNERVNALAFAQNGDLYAVGFFTQAGNLPADHAALWDGTAWLPLICPASGQDKAPFHT